MTDQHLNDQERPDQTGFAGLLGFTMTSADGDHVDGRIDVTAALHQPYGIVHGGVFCSVVETAASIGAALWWGDRGNVVGVSNYTHFLRATREGVLDVRARHVSREEKSQLWEVEIVDQTGRLVSRGEVQLANLVSADRLGQTVVAR